MNHLAPLVPFNRPFVTGHEQQYLAEALSSHGDSFQQRCISLLSAITGAEHILLTPSCTTALELAAALLVQPGDEVIMPAFTFTSSANAFVLRGATPVFVDCCPETLNIDVNTLRSAITSRTRVIVVVHYAGVGCEMDALLPIANEHGLTIVEDAAHAVGAFFKGSALGTFGQLGTYSFHQTKNITCGEGGALLIKNPDMAERARIILDKGTNRAQFKSGKISQYSWVDIGMSSPPSEYQAAVLLAQLEHESEITGRRRALWDQYQTVLQPLADKERITLPYCPADCFHNGHIYRIQFSTPGARDTAQKELLQHGIQTALHYQPLHLTEAGQRYGRTATSSGTLPVIEQSSSRLLRLPIYPELPSDTPERIADILASTLRKTGGQCQE